MTLFLWERISALSKTNGKALLKLEKRIELLEDMHKIMRFTRDSKGEKVYEEGLFVKHPRCSSCTCGTHKLEVINGKDSECNEARGAGTEG